MALYRRPSTVLTSEEEKLIFAPAGHHPHGQAPNSPSPSSIATTSTHPPPSPNSTPGSPSPSAPSISQPEACTLSTAQLPSGRVSSRVVYLKELDSHGFVMYTNLGTSRKAHDLQTNPHASLVFYWPPLQRQVRVEGITETYSREESQKYFDTRVRGSRIGAWASRQSVVLKPQPSAKSAPESGSEPLVNGTEPEHEDDGRAQLEGWVKEVEERFKGQDNIPVPDFWGGLRLVPQRVEFWQGRESRLHDRFVYEWEEGQDGKEGKWRLDRLSP
ncbi:hypothetical protein TrVFT333_001344 [Trichoderma virens FT-333]|nr:hypothetical protein TrVFT333_001344 [Trichoderma virens FT-333]